MTHLYVSVCLDVFPANRAPGVSAPAAIGVEPALVVRLIRELRPTYHFAGHYHEPGQRLAAAGETRSYELNAVNFLRPHRLNPGCIGVLRWAGPDESAFTFVDAPWLDEYTRSNYRYL